MEEITGSETRRLEVSLWVASDVRRELSSRVRLNFSIREPHWWSFSQQAVVTISGPAEALDSAIAAIRGIESLGQADSCW